MQRRFRRLYLPFARQRDCLAAASVCSDGQSLGDGKDKDVPGQSWTRSPRTFYSWVLSSLVSVSPVTLFPFGSSTPSLGPRLLAVPNHCSHSSDFTTNPISKRLCSQDQSEGDFGCIPAKLLGNEGSFVCSPTSVVFFYRGDALKCQCFNHKK